MFSFDNRDIPNVEQQILSYLGPRDLVRAKLVSKEWRTGVMRYIKCLNNAGKWKALYNRAFLEPVTCYAKVRLHKCELDIAVNDAGEVYILTEDSILQYDIADMCLEAELPFPTAHAERWQNFARKAGSKELSVSDDGQRFTVMIHDNTKYLGRMVDLFTFRRNASGTALEWSSCGGPLSAKSSLSMGYLASVHGNEDILIKIRNFADALLTDIVWLRDKSTAIFAMESKDAEHESRVYGVDAAAGVPSLLALIPMKSVKLHVIGTRVICQDTSPALDDRNNDAIIVFDAWNPDSVRRGGDAACVTELDLDKHTKLMYWTTTDSQDRILRNGCQCKTCASPRTTMSRGL